MSILIKGMEMPTSCMLCPFCVEEADPANGDMCLVTGTLMPPCTRERLGNCPLVPIPEHGRLIDADALIRDNGIREIPEYHEVILAAPTVIPAEEETDFYTKGHLHLGYAEEGE